MSYRGIPRALWKVHKDVVQWVIEDNPLDALKSDPELARRVAHEMAENVRRYGVLTLGGSQGGLWDSDLPGLVRGLLEENPRPLRITIEPEDTDCHHWVLRYEYLAWRRGRWIPLRKVVETKK